MVALSLTPALLDAPAPDAAEHDQVDWHRDVESRLERAGADTDTGAERPGSRREHVIAQIRLMNPGATREMLGSFTDSALSSYLDHLKAAAAPRGPHSRWLRPDASPGVTRYRPDGE